MSSKVELTITSNYVASWTIVDAVRELFQNALDQETQCPDNTFSWEYDDANVLRICNKASKLTIQSLLLGQSTKTDDEDTIGQFGEGYKLATLALLRAGKSVVINNYAAREVWKPRFVNSRRFGTEVLTFFIDKFVWSSPPTNDLTIEVHGITRQEYEDLLVPANLHMQASIDTYHSTEYGDILGKEFAHKVFVNGLYVCDNERLVYGYNFKPSALKLSRDRRLASDFDILWTSAKMWVNAPTVIEAVRLGVYDVKYINSVYAGTSDLRQRAYMDFVGKFGSKAIPVTSQEEYEAVPVGYTGRIVSPEYASLIKDCPNWSEPAAVEVLTLLDLIDLLIDWRNDNEDNLPGQSCEDLDAIIEKLQQYEKKEG